MPVITMPRKNQNHYDDDFESDDMGDDTETLISRNKPPRVKSVPVKKAKKSVRRPVSPTKTKLKTGRDRWLSAIKKQQTLGMSNNRHVDSPRHKTPIEYWVDTLRKTGTGMSTESTAMNSLTGLRKTNDLNLAYLSTSHYMRQVMGTEKSKRNVDDPSARTVAGTPAYKSPEEYYDQILELKKHITSLSQDNSTMKARVRRLEEDNIKKEKEIDGLLHPEKNEELRRTMGDRKPDSGAVIHSLKQKILKLEMQLRDKEASYVKLASELKTTKVDEMKIQMEVLYQEVLRLQNARDSGIEKARPGKESNAKVKALNETVIRLSRTNEQLQGENKTLKEDLEKALEEGDHDTSAGRRDHEDMNRRQLLAAITKAERRAERAERKLDTDNLSMASLDSRRSEVKGKKVLKGSLEERLHQLDERETELLDEIDKLKLRIKRLTSERARKRSEQGSVTPRGASPLSSSQRRHRPLSQESGRDTRINNFSQKHAATSIQRQWRQHRDKQRAEDERVARWVEDMQRNHAARTVQRQWRSNRQDERIKKLDQFRVNHAAKAIQNRWRRHRLEEEDNEEAAYVIQSALRGHQRRRRELRRHKDYDDDDDDDDEEYSSTVGSDDAVFVIQSSLKGHKARRERMRRMRLDSTGDEDDNDSYHGFGSRRVSASGFRRPSSAQSRSSVTRKTTYASYSGSRQPSGGDDDDDIVW